MQRNERFDTADRIIKVGFWVNALLMIMKLSAGYWGQSDAVFADGIESACDFIALLSTMIALKLGRQPYDEAHPYGHGRAESLAAIFVSLVIFLTGGWILFESIHTVIGSSFKSPEPVAVIAAVITIIIKEWLYRYSYASGSRIDSPAVLAIAKDHRKDAVTSIATVVGVGGAFFGLGIMDPLAAGLTSLFILHIGWETFKDAAHDLMDGAAPPDFVEEITKLASGVGKVEGVHEIKARRSGQYMIIDLKLEMNPDMTVKESHSIATEVKRLIFEKYSNVGDVMIHINPYEEEHIDLIRL